MIRRQRTKKKRGMITGCIRDDNEMIARNKREDGKKEEELPITIGLESPAMLPSWPASCAGTLTGLIGEKARGGNLTPVDQFQGKSVPIAKIYLFVEISKFFCCIYVVSS